MLLSKVKTSVYVCMAGGNSITAIIRSGQVLGLPEQRVAASNLATILPRPPPGPRPGMWTPTRHGPAPRISTKKNPMGGILCRESRHMPIEA